MSEHNHLNPQAPIGPLPDVPRDSSYQMRCGTCGSHCRHIEVLLATPCLTHGYHYDAVYACTECQIDLLTSGPSHTHMVPIFGGLL